MNKTIEIKKSTIRNFFLSLIIGFSLLSCKLDNRQEDLESLKVSIDSTKTFEYKLKNKPKIFLKYWAGMSNNEYHRVSNILLSENILKETGVPYENVVGIYLYNIGSKYMKLHKFSFSENYEDSFDLELGEYGKEIDTVDGIMLSGFNKAIYDTFKDKYNLPDASLKETQYYSLLEYTYPPSNNETRMNYLKRRILTKEEIFTINQRALDKGNSILLHSVKRLSLDNKEIIKTKQNTNIIFRDIHGFNKHYNLYYNEEGTYADRNTETRLIEHTTSTSFLSVIYTEKNRLDIIKKQISDSIIKKESEKQNKRLQKEQRENNYKKEI